MASADILRRLETDPSSVSVNERLVAGVGVIEGILLYTGTVEQLQQSPLNEAFWTAVQLASSSLSEIRTGDQFSERQRLRAALIAFPCVGPVLEASDKRLDGITFMQETLTTFFHGKETLIKNWIYQSNRDIIKGFNELTGACLLYRAPNDLSATDQVKFIYESTTLNSLDDRRRVALAWAKRLIAPDTGEHEDQQPVSLEQQVEIISYFKEQGDLEAIKEIGAAVTDEQYGKILKHFFK